MSTHAINRLVKSKDSQGNDELFLELSITDDLGTYPFGKWLSTLDVESIRSEFGDLFELFNDLNGFTPAVFSEPVYQAVLAKVSIVATSLLPVARAQKVASNAAATADNSTVTDPVMASFNARLAVLTADGYLDPVLNIRIKGDNRAMVERWTPQTVSVLNFLTMGLPASTPMTTYDFNDGTVAITMGEFQQLMARFAVWFNAQFAAAAKP